MVCYGQIVVILPTLFLTTPLFSPPYYDTPAPFNIIFSILDLLHFRLFLSLVTHISSSLNKSSSTLFYSLDNTSSVELSLKVDEVAIKLALFRCYIFSLMHIASCHCFCITPFFSSFPSIKWFLFHIHFQTFKFYVEFYLRRVGFSHWFAGIFSREVNYFFSSFFFWQYVAVLVTDHIVVTGADTF